MSNIYVASSWRNKLQPEIVQQLRTWGHEVYDFRNPPGRAGFGWSQIDPDWKAWDAKKYREILNHPIAIAGYNSDMKALKECEVCVYVLPCGRSASWEFGYAMGQEKVCYVVQFEPQEPELMFREATIITSPEELYQELGGPCVPSAHGMGPDWT